MSRYVVSFVAWLLAASALWVAPSGAADQFPSRAVKLVVPFPPAGSGDVIARLLSERLTPMWGVPVVVENKPGAAAMIGADVVAKAQPDGHTLLVIPNNIQTINPALYRSMPFDARRAFRSITLIGNTPFVLVAGPSVKAATVSELIVEAKGRSNGMTYASSGVGSVQHLAGELFRSLTGLALVHVPYKGGAPAVVDLVSGQVDIQFGAATAVVPHVRSGKLKALAVTGQQRTSLLPDVPTMIEAGIAGYVSEPWIGLAAPANTPDDVVEKVNRDVRAAMVDPNVARTLAEQGVDVATTSGEELDARIEREARQWAKIIAEAGIRGD
ncbi:MAG: tripartite tricarboxylate transporter substrate binding protein [Pigmentiphaga sp.]|uniref:Bug family tripartite tricarboxylate transporter substrate binding protein n=1 Tax=Pigmentiphaga sp. TaxID=1977564 RepID=UPI0029AFB354|nr:tripartite tricarboxylate transporter substrate binding protein [Pigmentiphaga sp.]MDX3905963.1 tripartite tricarboxylate transporter substrate binding protein [Pigmentiphaga sp.]